MVCSRQKPFFGNLDFPNHLRKKFYNIDYWIRGSHYLIGKEAFVERGKVFGRRILQTSVIASEEEAAARLQNHVLISDFDIIGSLFSSVNKPLSQLEQDNFHNL